MISALFGWIHVPLISMTWVKFPCHETKFSTEGNNNIFENVSFLFKL